MNILKSAALIILSSSLISCQTTGEAYKANVYKASQINRLQRAEQIKIVSVNPAKIQVSNYRAKEKSTTLGAIIGAAIGGSESRDAAGAGALLGGIIGNHATDDTVLVEGVSITYIRNSNSQTYHSAQAGRMCEFKAGQATLVTTNRNRETRIQPNSSCPNQ